MAGSNTISILIDAKDLASAKVGQAADNIRSSTSRVSEATRTLGDESDRASSKTSNFNESLHSMGRMVEGVAVAFAVYQTGAVISQFVSTAFGTAAKLEQTNMAFQSLIGNAQEASGVFSQLIQYANTTPFESKDIVQAAQTLMGFGTAGQQTVDVIKKLGDVVSTSGGDMNALALVTGQIFSQGKMRAQDMYQIINDGGAGVLKIMADGVGGMKNLTDMFDKGGVPAQLYFDAVNKATANGGFAFEGAQKQANTFNGQLSTLKDTVTQFGMKLIGVTIDPKLGYVIEKGGLFDEAKNIIHDLNNNLQGLNASSVLLGIEAVAAFAALAASVWLVKGAISVVVDTYDGLMKLKDGVVWVATKVGEWGSTAIDAAKTFGGAVVDMTKKGADLAVDLGSRAGATAKAWGTAAVDIASSWASNIASVTKTVVTEGPKIALHAIDASVAWILNGIRIGIVWAESMATIVARSTWAAIMATPHAIATGAAWVRSAAVAAFAWVTVELPKIVRSFIVTSASAASNAIVASAAWVKNAAVSSVAWVTVELPKIIAAFVVTSSSAVAHAAIASATWVASASTSAVAWVVTQLPRIVAAFAVTSASAVTNAAIATSAWVGSAVTSTASFGALSALVATPLVMPAIVITAAIIAIQQVIDAYNKAQVAIQGAQNSTKQLMDVTISNDKHFLEVAGNPVKYGPQAAAQARQYLHNEGYPGYALGGFTGQGSKNDVAGIVHKGEYVVPKDQVDQTTGKPKMIGNGLTVNQYITNQLDYDRGIKEIGFLLRAR